MLVERTAGSCEADVKWRWTQTHMSVIGQSGTAPFSAMVAAKGMATSGTHSGYGAKAHTLARPPTIAAGEGITHL